MQVFSVSAGRELTPDGKPNGRNGLMEIVLRDRMIRLLVTAGLLLATSMWSGGETLGKDFSSIASEKDDLIRAKVYRLIIDPGSQQPAVILSDALEERGLFIWISAFEANAIHSEMNGIEHFRPLTHDLLERIIKKADLRIERVIVTHIQKGVYYATLVIKKGSSDIEIDARPSDSIVMALKFNAPIFVSQRLFKEASVLLREKEKVEEGYGLTLQDLTPSLADAFDFESTHGVLVSGVKKQSRAERDGLERGDIIVEVGGRAVDNVNSMRGALTESEASVESRIFRKGQLISLTIHPN
jgi:bifunctional DNase/RNase